MILKGLKSLKNIVIILLFHVFLTQTVEKFFSKEIKYLVSNKKEARYVNCLRQTSPVPSPDSGQCLSHPVSNLHKPCSHGDNVKGRSLNQTDTVSCVYKPIKQKCPHVSRMWYKNPVNFYLFCSCFAVCCESREVFGGQSSERAG